jgi:hypothetical protein
VVGLKGSVAPCTQLPAFCAGQRVVRRFTERSTADTNRETVRCRNAEKGRELRRMIKDMTDRTKTPAKPSE